MSRTNLPERVDFRGQPCVVLQLGAGDRVLISLQGAQVLSWVTADCHEQFYLSPTAHFDGCRPIRGGVPVCFPQFNQRVLGQRALPKHGFARTEHWRLLSSAAADPSVDEAAATLLLDTETLSGAMRALWPHPFSLALTVRLAPGTLSIGMTVHNTGTTPWPFSTALHTYLRVSDTAATELKGLEHQCYWDAVTHAGAPDTRSPPAIRALLFSGETDQVYSGVINPLQLTDSRRTLRITQSFSLPEAVVWTPGKSAAALDDIPTGDERHFVCVEAACINKPVELQGGSSWQGWQQLAVTVAS